MGSILHDVRLAVRSIGRRPGFATAAIVTLALGIGATTALFSVVRGVLLRPLPLRDGERLVRVYLVPDTGTQRISLRPASFLAVRERSGTLSGVVAHRFTEMTLESESGPERIVGIAVSEGWAETLGVTPVLGRSFSPEEQRQGESSGVVVVSHGFWERLGRPADVLGRSLRVSGTSRRIVGVMPRGFAFPYEAELWYPIRVDLNPQWTWGLNVQARLRDDVTPDEVRAELSAVGDVLRSELPDVHRDANLTAIPTRETLVGDQGPVLLALLGAVGFVLAIGCANVASLLLARALSRRTELAVRAALGAGRGRQLRLLLTESLVLSLAGGALGATLAFWGVPLLERLVPPALVTLTGPLSADASSLGFAAALSIATGLLFGALPALRGARGGLVSDLRQGARSVSGNGRAFRGLVVAETALAVVLLSGAGVLSRNLAELQGQELGYPPEGLATMQVSLDRPDYEDPGRRRQLVSRVEEELRALPGVAAAGVTTMFPSHQGNVFTRVEVEGADPAAEPVLTNYRAVSPGFFPALRLELVRGRGFGPEDGPDSERVAVVSRSAARRFWPGQDPLGRRLRLSGRDSSWLRVVGVVGDVQEFYDAEETCYLPYAQEADRRGSARTVIAVRSEGPLLREAALRAAVAAADPTLPAYGLQTVTDLHRERLGLDRFGAQLASAFAGVGLLMACLGLHGVLSYLMLRRRREIALRMALGAAPGRVRLQVLAHGCALLGSGLALGIGAAWALAGQLGRIATAVEPRDPALIAGAAALLGLAGLAASDAPARAATRTDPMLSMREE